MGVTWNLTVFAYFFTVPVCIMIKPTNIPIPHYLGRQSKLTIKTRNVGLSLAIGCLLLLS